MDQQTSQIPPEAQERIALRQERRVVERRDRELQLSLHREFMDECIDMGFRFGHVSPMTEKDRRAIQVLKMMGKQKNDHAVAVEIPIENGQMPRLPGVKRPLPFLELAAWGIEATVCYYQRATDLLVAVALVGEGDNFCRRTGRDIAANRLMAFMKDLGSGVGDVHVWQISMLSPYYKHQMPIHAHLADCIKATAAAVQERKDGDTFWKPAVR